jgi:hypothetical protein
LAITEYQAMQKLIAERTARLRAHVWRETSKIRASDEAERIQVGLSDDFIGRRQS